MSFEEVKRLADEARYAFDEFSRMQRVLEQNGAVCRLLMNDADYSGYHSPYTQRALSCRYYPNLEISFQRNI